MRDNQTCKVATSFFLSLSLDFSETRVYLHIVVDGLCLCVFFDNLDKKFFIILFIIVYQPTFVMTLDAVQNLEMKGENSKILGKHFQFHISNFAICKLPKCA